jgi:hypothetical protein
MTPQQVEWVAQAFYEAEYGTEWHDAPEDVQELFRDLAYAAIAVLSHQITDCRHAALALA